MCTLARLALLALVAVPVGCGGGGGGGSGGGGGPHPVSFQSPTPVTLGLIPSETLTLDANHDAYADVAVLGRGLAAGVGSRLQVHLGGPGGLNPTPSFETELLNNFPPISLEPRAFVVDSDGDGDEDIAFAFRPTPTEVLDTVYVYLSNGDGTFSLFTHFTAPPPIYYGPISDAELVYTDLNSQDDLAVLHAPTSYPGGTWRLGEYVRDLAGDFVKVGTPTVLLREPLQLARIDVDGNGTHEVIVVYGAPDPSEVYQATSTGYVLHAYLPTASTGDVGHRVAAGDLDGDGLVDAVTSPSLSGPETSEYFAGFMIRRPNPEPNVVGEKDLPLLADLSGDGVLDLLVATRLPAADRFFAYLGAGDGTFAPTGTPIPITGTPIGTGILTGAVGDVNGDGRPDLVHTEAGAAPGTYVLRVTLQQ